MPLSSADVSAQVGQYQQVYAGYNQHSSLIGGMMGSRGPAGVQGEQVAGGLLSRAASIGAPLGGLALGLAGMDPMSMGMRAGMASYGTMGLAGGAAMGLGVAGIASAGMAGVHYAGSQMYQGAQQQQQLNAGLRSSFNFVTPSGQGFTTGQMGSIGQQIRGMSGQMGPTGEMASFQELSSLAANMGRMGNATGVRDVQEFGRKFKEMVTTLKTVAQEMGTSLEAAQQFTQSMKGSGIFRAADQMRMAGETRAFSLSGNVSVAELSAAGNIGSQISRAVGGRGRAGAMAGVRTLGQIGEAMQVGTLTEEDIYNATGQTGAAGMQALAASRMQQSAAFLKGGRGRRFLASIAGENGQLDAGSVDEWMGGGVGTGRTMGMAGRNLSKVGRASFIRNEGRLRGEAMAAFGGNVNVMALSQWVGERGMDINNMDDRMMLFASRQTGMGMDELETAVKELKDLPRIQKHRRQTQESDQYLRQIAEKRRGQGVEGLKRKFEHGREHIQGKLQQFGADMYTDLASGIEAAINKMSDVSFEEADKDFQKAYEAAMTGSKSSAARFGIGSTKRAGAGMVGTSQFGAGRASAGGGSWAAFSGSTAMQGMMGKLGNDFMGMTGGLLGVGLSKVMQGGSDLDRYTKAGYGDLFKGVAGSANQDKALQKALQDANEIRTGALMGNNKAAFGAGQSLGAGFQDEFIKRNIASKSGADRVAATEALLRDLAKGDGASADAAKSALAQMGTDPRSRANIVGSVEAGSGIGGGVGLGASTGLPGVGGVGGRFATRDERDKALGQSFLNQGEVQSGWSRFMKGASAGAAVGATLGVGIGAIPGALIGGIAGWANGRAPGENQRAVGDFLSSEKGSKLSDDILAGGERSEGAMGRLRGEIQTMQREGGNEAAIDVRQRMMAAAAVMKVHEEAAKSGKPANPKDLEKAAKSVNGKLTVADAHAAAGTMAAYASEREDANLKAGALLAGSTAQQRRGSMLRGGQIDADGKLSSDLEGNLRKAGGDKFVDLSRANASIVDKQLKAAEAAKAGDVEMSKWQTEMAMAEGKAKHDKFINMSPAEYRKFVASGGIATAADKEAVQAGQQFDRGMRQRGGAGMAAALGLHMSDKERREASRLGGSQTSDMLIDKLGLGGPSASAAQAALEQYSGADGKAKAGMEKEFAAAKKTLETAQKSDPLRDELINLGKLKDKAEGKGGTASDKEAFKKALIEAAPKVKEAEMENERRQGEKNDPSLRLLDTISTKLDKLSSLTGIEIGITGISTAVSKGLKVSLGS